MTEALVLYSSQGDWLLYGRGSWRSGILSLPRHGAHCSSVGFSPVRVGWDNLKKWILVAFMAHLEPNKFKLYLSVLHCCNATLYYTFQVISENLKCHPHPQIVPSFHHWF